MKKAAFASEAAMCAAFIEVIDKRIWTPYAETAGWDILLSRKIDGFQIGVQAKLALNVGVVNQAIESHGGWMAAAPAPDARAILVPDGSLDRLAMICDYIGVCIITIGPRYNKRFEAWPALPSKPDQYGSESWHEWCPVQRHKLPEYVPDVVAGSSAPVQLTTWKIKAIKLAVLLERNGTVSRLDFKFLDLDHRRWIANEWLLPDKGGYIRGGMPDLKKQHPRV